MIENDDITMTLKGSEHFKLDQEDKNSPFHGLSLYVKNNGNKIVLATVSRRAKTIIIEMEDA